MKRGAANQPGRASSRPSALLDTRIIYCGDGLDRSEPRPSGSGSWLPDACVDSLYLWHRFPSGESISNRNDDVFWGGLSEPRPSGSGFIRAFKDRHASTAAYIDTMRPRCVELARVLKKTGGFYNPCDKHA